MSNPYETNDDILPQTGGAENCEQSAHRQSPTDPAVTAQAEGLAQPAIKEWYALSDAALKAEPSALKAYGVPILAENLPRPFAADATDALFALIFSCVGYFYIESIEHLSLFAGVGAASLSWGAWVFPLFVCVYAAAVLGYFYVRNITPSKESWVWLGVLLALGLPLPFYSVAFVFQLPLLHLVALYWPLCAASALLCGGKTGGALLLDAMNAGLIVPWGNFFSHCKVLFKFVKKGVPRARWVRHVLLVLLGLLLAVPVLLVVMPLLAGADAAFSDFLNTIEHWIDRWIETNIADFWWKLLFSLPVTCLLFGAVYGAVHRRHTTYFTPHGTHAVCAQVRVVPTTAMATVFCVVGAVYALFLGLQSSYLFGAFAGHLPETFSYSAYAREGFFELCRLGGVNLAILVGSNLLCRTPRRENGLLRACNVVLCVLSLLLTATAAAKLGMYIAAYGLTVNRVLPAVFLLWMAVVFLAVMVWQMRSFSVVRFAVLTLAVLVGITCAVDVPDVCIAYNESRVQAGTLEATVEYSESYRTWGLGTYGLRDT